MITKIGYSLIDFYQLVRITWWHLIRSMHKIVRYLKLEFKISTCFLLATGLNQGEKYLLLFLPQNRNNSKSKTVVRIVSTFPPSSQCLFWVS